MINLEEEARKRRERLKSAFSTSNESSTEKESFVADSLTSVEQTTEQDDTFKVPEDEVLLDASGAEILSLDSK